MKILSLALVVILSAVPATAGYIDFWAYNLSYRNDPTTADGGSTGQIFDSTTPVTGASTTSYSKSYGNGLVSGFSSLDNISGTWMWKASSVTEGDFIPGQDGYNLLMAMEARAHIYDEVTVSGTQGPVIFEMDWTVHGNTSASWQIPSIPNATDNMFSGLEFRCSEGVVGSFASTCGTPDATGAFDGPRTTYSVAFADGASDFTVRLKYYMSAGLAYYYTFDPAIVTRWSVQSDPGGVYRATLAADFSHTSTLTAARITDLDGNDITGATLSSISGMDYLHVGAASEAPEPSTAAFALTGFAMVMLVRRRRAS